MTSTAELGAIGIRHYSGYVREEWNHKLAGREMHMYREMLDNVPVLGGWFALIELVLRQVDLRVDARRDAPSAIQERDRIEESLKDMRTPLRTVLGEVASGMPFGFVAWEKTFKVRRGPDETGRELRSKYSDGRVGWFDWGLRSQETIERFSFDDHDEWISMEQRIPSTQRVATMPREKLVHFVPRSWKRSPFGWSSLRSCVRAYRLLMGHEDKEAIGADKNHAGQIWAELPVTYFGPSADADSTAIKAAIEEGIGKFRSGEYSALTFPAEFGDDGVTRTGFKLNQFSGARGGFPSDTVIRRIESRMLIALLADVLIMGQGDHGSFALSATKKNLLAMAIGSIVSGACEVFTEQASELSTLNGVPPEDHAIIAHDDIETPELTHVANFVAQILGVDPARLNNEMRRYLETYARMPRGALGEEPAEQEPAPAPEPEPEEEETEPEATEEE